MRKSLFLCGCFVLTGLLGAETVWAQAPAAARRHARRSHAGADHVPGQGLRRCDPDARSLLATSPNGDGVPDFLLTSTWSNVPGFCSGRVLVISGRTPAAPCASQPHYRQFDFWVGEWDVTAQGRKFAESSIQPLIPEQPASSCVIYEHYRQPDGYHGKSFNFYDAHLGQWRQT